MTPPARRSPKDDPRTASAAGSSGGAARWINIVTTLALAAALLIVAFAAAPSVVRAALRSREDPGDFAPPVRSRNITLVPRDHPGSHRVELDPNDDDQEDTLPVPPPRPRGAGLGHGAPQPPGDDVDEPGGLGLGLKGGVTLRPLPLRDRRTGTVIEQVRAGAEVSILRADGEWLLIVQRSGGELVTGWAKKSELFLR
jgi:hypothetical protein